MFNPVAGQGFATRLMSGDGGKAARCDIIEIKSVNGTGVPPYVSVERARMNRRRGPLASVQVPPVNGKRLATQR